MTSKIADLQQKVDMSSVDAVNDANARVKEYEAELTSLEADYNKKEQDLTRSNKRLQKQTKKAVQAAEARERLSESILIVTFLFLALSKKVVVGDFVQTIASVCYALWQFLMWECNIVDMVPAWTKVFPMIGGTLTIVLIIFFVYDITRAIKRGWNWLTKTEALISTAVILIFADQIKSALHINTMIIFIVIQVVSVICFKAVDRYCDAHNKTDEWNAIKEKVSIRGSKKASDSDDEDYWPISVIEIIEKAKAWLKGFKKRK